MNDRTGRSYGGNNPPPDAAIDSGHVFSGNCRAPRPESEAVVLSLKDQMQLVEHNLVEKVDLILLVFFLFNRFLLLLIVI